MKAGRVAPGVLQIFEDALYQVYKPRTVAADRNPEAKLEAADRDLDAKFTAFKEQSAGKTLHDAAKVVRAFIIWQHNFAEGDKPDDPTDTQKDHARRIERAFLIGAAGIAFDGFVLQQTDETLFLMNIVGTYLGLGPGEAEDEISQTFEASEAEEEATKIGWAAMTDYLANGKTDKHKVLLASLQKKVLGLIMQARTARPLWDQLFPPGEPDEHARAACLQFARKYGCRIENKSGQRELWFVKVAWAAISGHCAPKWGKQCSRV